MNDKISVFGEASSQINVDMPSIAVMMKGIRSWLGPVSYIVSCFGACPHKVNFCLYMLIKGRTTEDSLQHKCHIQTSWKQTPDPQVNETVVIL